MQIREQDRVENVEYKFIFMMDMVSQDILGNGLLEEALEYIESAVSDGANILVHW